MAYDLVVVGAGTAGCMASYTASKLGLKVCLIDRKPYKQIGDKVCGDAIGKHHFEYLEIEEPLDCVESVIKCISVYSPDKEAVFKIKGRDIEGFTLNRHKFGQKLLGMCINSGVELLDGHTAIRPLVMEGFVRGVELVDSRGAKKKIEGKVTIDASGFTAILRNNLPSEFGIEKPSRGDFIACYREIRSSSDYSPHECLIFLDQDIAPGGYYWIFPEGEDKINVGIGISMELSYPNPKEALHKYVIKNQKTRVIKSGGWAVPIRRPLDSLVADGIMFVGDAGCLVNPIHGGGMGPSMISGKIAAEVASYAISSDDVSKKSLWRYNIEYMRSYGAKQASLDVFRVFLQSLSNRELNYGMKYQLIKDRDVLKTSIEGELKLSLSEKILRLFSGFGNLRLVIKLKKIAEKMRDVKNLYMKYPSINGFESWRGKVRRIFQELRREFPPFYK